VPAAARPVFAPIGAPTEHTIALEAQRRAGGDHQVEIRGICVSDGQFNLRPLQIAQFRSPQTMPIADQDHSRVPMAVAAGLPGSRHQPLDLGRRQILAGAN
jgi:hypothetical protein